VGPYCRFIDTNRTGAGVGADRVSISDYIVDEYDIAADRFESRWCWSEG
jgi:hypothetical protein